MLCMLTEREDEVIWDIEEEYLYKSWEVIKKSEDADKKTKNIFYNILADVITDTKGGNEIFVLQDKRKRMKRRA